MSLVTRRENGNRSAASSSARDPFALARELFGWDPYGYGGRTAGAQAFTPAFEVRERPDAFLLRADLPGVKEADIDVSVNNGVLTVSGVRNQEDRQEGESYYLFERSYGNFTRSFALPDTADTDKIDAQLDDGVLTLTISKKVQAKPRKIELKKH